MHEDAQWCRRRGPLLDGRPVLAAQLMRNLGDAEMTWTLLAKRKSSTPLVGEVDLKQTVLWCSGLTNVL
jgi:hypothetical protein